MLNKIAQDLDTLEWYSKNDLCYDKQGSNRLKVSFSGFNI
jgi:hypothetical protein